MNIESINERWMTFKRQVIPREASSGQIQEMKVAFYAGAASLLGATTEISMIAEEEKAIEALDKLHVESRDFFTSEPRGLT